MCVVGGSAGSSAGFSAQGTPGGQAHAWVLPERCPTSVEGIDLHRSRSSRVELGGEGGRRGPLP